jgi:SpoVK/Ycf46/Vps4 family AAA+-type ATPase
MTAKTKKQEIQVSEGYKELNTNLNDLISSGVGIIGVVTDEPHQAIESIKANCYGKNTSLSVWNSFVGFREVDIMKKEAMDYLDPIKGTNAVMAAVKYIIEEETEKSGKKAAFEKHMYILNWCHWAMKKESNFIQALSDMSLELTNGNKKVVMILPQGFEIAPELKNNIALISLDLPGKQEINDIIEVVLKLFTRICRERKKLDIDEELSITENDKELIANNLSGMTRFWAETSLTRAFVENKADLPDVSVTKLIATLSKIRTEEIKKSEILELMPSENIKNVGGLDNLKSYINKRTRAFSKEAKDFGVKTPKGVLLVGPPGTGKSVSAKAISSVLQLDLIRFDVSRVFNALVGSSEQRIKSCLKLIEAMSPCVVLIDEIDKIFNQNTGGGDSGVGNRVLGSVLTFMQESKASIYWVFTANRIGGLPPELMRKGRLDDIFFVGLPNDEEREQILKIHLSKRNQKVKEISNLNLAVEASDNYASAEIEHAVNEAVMQAFNEDIPLTGELIAGCIKAAKPLYEQFKEQFELMSEWAEKNAKYASKNAKTVTKGRSRKRKVSSSASRKVDIDNDDSLAG